MRLLEDKKISRNEKIMVLALNAKPAVLLFSGLLTSIVVLGILLGVLFLFHVFMDQPFTFVLPTTQILYFVVFLLLFGALNAKLKTVQYALHKAASRGSSAYEAMATSVNFVFPLAICAFIFIMLHVAGVGGKEDIESRIMLFLIIGIFATMVIKQMWDLFFGVIMILLTNVDWRLIIDKERFTHMLRLRFDESKRYPGPFTMMMISIKDYDKLVKNAPQAAVIAMQEKVIDFINRSVRTVDIVGRIEQGQFIGVLLHTSGVEAKIPAERIQQIARDLTLNIHKSQFTPVFYFGIANFEQTMQHEREIYEKGLDLLGKATDEAPIQIN